jgi:hypothetical protein
MASGTARHWKFRRSAGTAQKSRNGCKPSGKKDPAKRRQERLLAAQATSQGISFQVIKSLLAFMMAGSAALREKLGGQQGEAALRGKPLALKFLRERSVCSGRLGEVWYRSGALENVGVSYLSFVLPQQHNSVLFMFELW